MSDCITTHFHSHTGEGSVAAHTWLPDCSEGEIKGVSIPEGSYFANDAIIAKAGESVAAHMHQKGRNSYLYMPLDVWA